MSEWVSIKYQAPMSEWVNIKDRLPEEGQVIIYMKHTPIIGQVGRYCGEKDPMPSSPRWLPWKDVTHWMPLFELPETEKLADV